MQKAFRRLCGLLGDERSAWFKLQAGSLALQFAEELDEHGKPMDVYRGTADDGSDDDSDLEYCACPPDSFTGIDDEERCCGRAASGSTSTTAGRPAVTWSTTFSGATSIPSRRLLILSLPRPPPQPGWRRRIPVLGRGTTGFCASACTP
mmetsp:Transcript_32799/g.87001  ORF Transcript_32799/g.87001 Transcript_32799/m.87001 type:complete len:149 (-) Transcript_32799:126-572(-)